MPSTTVDRITGISTSVAVKAPCRVATTAAITLSGTQTIDGVAVVAGDRVLVKNQSNSATNGIYEVDTGAWDRSADLDGSDDVVNGTIVFVRQGTTNGSNWFQATLENYPLSVGTDDLTWAITYASLTAVTSATETTAGIAELATQAETNTGTDDARIVTPLKLKTLIQSTPYDTGQVSTDAGATEGPTDELYRDSASPANADLLGVRSWAMRSSTAVKRVAAKILARIVDVTNASEDVALDFYTIIAGTLARRFSLGAGIYANGLTDMGAGTVNATGLYVNGVATSGKLVNRYYAAYTANSDLSTAIPVDDTTPLITEGDQVLSVAVTTTSATQVVRARFNGFGGASAGSNISATLWRDSTLIGATNAFLATTSHTAALSIVDESIPGSAASFTYTVRVGPASGTARLNGTSGGRFFNGNAKATLSIDVIEP